MSQPAPGRYYRQGMSLKALFRKFPNDETAQAWFVKTRWPNGIACHYCGSTNVQTGAKHKTMPFRCREKECAKRFSVRTGTVMQSSKLGYQTWAIAAYLMSTNLKGISSMKLHREVDITQKSAWHLAHRLRAMLPGHGSLHRTRSPKGIANHPTRFGQYLPIAVGKDVVSVGERQLEPIGKTKHIDRHRQRIYLDPMSNCRRP